MGIEGFDERKKDDITFHSVRGGEIVSDHEILFIGDNEIFKINTNIIDDAKKYNAPISKISMPGNNTTHSRNLDRLHKKKHSNQKHRLVCP